MSSSALELLSRPSCGRRQLQGDRPGIVLMDVGAPYEDAQPDGPVDLQMGDACAWCPGGSTSPAYAWHAHGTSGREQPFFALEPLRSLPTRSPRSEVQRLGGMQDLSRWIGLDKVPKRRADSRDRSFRLRCPSGRSRRLAVFRIRCRWYRGRRQRALAS